MKLTKSQLKQIIKEELETLNEYNGDEYAAEYAPGDLIEVTVSDDGYYPNIEKLQSADQYQNERVGLYGPALKMLVKVLQVAPDPEY